MERLKELFEQVTALKAEKTQELGASGSNRRYFRLSGGNVSFVGVVGSNPDENRAFISLSRHLRGKGINVPRVLGTDSDGMRYIQEDLGDLSLYTAVSKGRESGIYSPEEEDLLCRTVAELPEIQFKGAQGLDWSVCFPEPEFNSRMILSDLNYFKYCFLKPSGLEFDEIALQDDFEALKLDLLEEDCQAFMYRDFQARNVMLKDGEPYFIDFQGGRKGPVHYDLVSFVWQARARYPKELRSRMVRTYLDALSEYADVDQDSFCRKLRLFALFRTLQVLGAYGFRGNFERKQHFLDSIPFAMENLRDLLSEPFGAYPCLCGVLQRLAAVEEYSMPRKKDASGQDGELEVEVMSFSFKKGLPADASGNGGGYVFDCRGLDNPGRYERYRQLTGMDEAVVRFLEEDGGIFTYLGNVRPLVDAHVKAFIARGFTHLQVCFGCTGGRHRSVYSAESLARHISSEFGVRVRLRHRELGVEKVFPSRKSFVPCEAGGLMKQEC